MGSMNSGCVDKVVLVVGGSRGIGEACCHGLAAAGAEVVVSARSLARAQEVASRIVGGGGRAYAVAIDLADVEATAAVIDEVRADRGRLDGLVASAGVNPYFVRPQKVTPQMWDESLNVNLRGTFFAMQAAGRHMLTAGGGSIVVLSSVTATRGTRGGLPYVAAKGGLDAAVRTMALEWAEHGVRVNAVAPAYIETEMTEGLRGHDGLSKMAMSRTPMGRYGTAAEVAGLVTFLISDSASYMTAQVIPVDGGLTVG